MDEDKFAELASVLDEDYGLIEALRALYDWGILVDALSGYQTISEAKVSEYEQHRKDLAFLKRIIRKYMPEKYKEVFKDAGKNNYVAYSHHGDKDIMALISTFPTS